MPGRGATRRAAQGPRRRDPTMTAPVVELRGVRVSLAPKEIRDCLRPGAEWFDVDLWFENARASLRSAQLEDAEIDLRWLLVLAPDCALLHRHLADVLLYSGCFDLARLHAAKAARLAAATIGRDRNDRRGAHEL